MASVNGQTGAVEVSTTDLSDTDITSPEDNQVLSYDSTTGKWINATPADGPGNATAGAPGLIQLDGDLGGTATSPTVAKIDGISLPSSAPSANQVLTATSSTATEWSTPASGVELDTTTSDIQPLGTQTAGSIGKAADAGHVHAMPTASQVGAVPESIVTTKGDLLAGTGNATIARLGAGSDGQS